jgi:hypothetical protein
MARKRSSFARGVVICVVRCRGPCVSSAISFLWLLAGRLLWQALGSDVMARRPVQPLLLHLHLENTVSLRPGQIFLLSTVGVEVVYFPFAPSAEPNEFPDRCPLRHTAGRSQ